MTRSETKHAAIEAVGKLTLLALARRGCPVFHTKELINVLDDHRVRIKKDDSVKVLLKR
jgi:hypothetical protein